MGKNEAIVPNRYDISDIMEESDGYNSQSTTKTFPDMDIAGSYTKVDSLKHNGLPNDPFCNGKIGSDGFVSETLRADKNIYENRYAHTSKRFFGFLRLVSHWKGSLFKLVCHDVLIFLFLYYLISILYKQCFIHYEYLREGFELLCIYCSRFRHLVPVTFLTGFYVAEVMRRYWDQFMSLPFPDKLALKLVSFIPGQELFERNLRRTVMRYVNLSIVLVFRLVSKKVQDRFPDYQSLMDARLMLPLEKDRLTRIDNRTPHEATWTPILWALKLIVRARTQKKISIEAPVFSNLLSSFEYIEVDLRKLLNHGWVNFPLAYTQVATISVFAYLGASLFSAQHLMPRGDNLDSSTFPLLNASFSRTDPFKFHTPFLYFPFFTILEFVSYMGWINVAEALLNPFGSDDEDFEINYLIDRNLQVSYMIVDEDDLEIDLAADPFMEAGIAVPANLPYKDEGQQETSFRKTMGEEVHSFSTKMRRLSRMRRNKTSSIRSSKSVSGTANDQVGEGRSTLRIRTLNRTPSEASKASNATAAFADQNSIKKTSTKGVSFHGMGPNSSNRVHPEAEVDLPKPTNEFHNRNAVDATTINVSELNESDNTSKPGGRFRVSKAKEEEEKGSSMERNERVSYHSFV